jgi:pimeloyl-ACP methyl ester carboxylesterase
MDETLRAQIRRSARKIVLDFQVAFTDPGLEAVRALKCPVRVVSGGRTRAPTRRIASFLADALPSAELEVVADANHLLPVTHPDLVAAFLLEELAE